MSTLIAVSILGVLCLILEVFNIRKMLIPIMLASLIAILIMNFIEIYTQESFFTGNAHNMIIDTPYSRQFSILFIMLTFFILAMSLRFYQNQIEKIADYVALKIFLLAGAIVMVSFENLTMFFIGLEVLSVALYILASSNPKDQKSNEAGMKYFIMGAFASSFTLLGIALIYGAVGSFDVNSISAYEPTQEGSTWFYAGIILISVGLFFKASIFPFHFWAPDVYEGSPTLVTALMSTLVRVAAIATLYKILTIFIAGLTPNFQILLIVLTILTMTVGNITALKQKNMKRMMAYSGISHTGFMMMTLVALNTSANTIYYYAFAYSMAGIAAFSVILSVCHDKGNEDISNFYGLFHKKPLLAVILTCSMLSMGGLPIFAGFFAKFFVFEASGNLILIIAGIINTIIAVYYYVRVVNLMFTKESETKESIAFPFEYMIVGIIAIAINLLLGIFPALIMI